MFTQPNPPSADEQQVVIDPLGPGEWIVILPERSLSLHVYELGPADWLVSEVGRSSEGRGTDLKQALQELSTSASVPECWEAVPEALDEKSKTSRRGA